MEDLLPAWNQVKMNSENVEDCNPKTCLGITEMGSHQSQQTLVAQSQLVSSEGSTRISSQPNFSSDSHLERPEGFPCQNGSMSSKGRQLTSTRSSRCYTVSQLIKRKRLTCETLKSVSVELKQNRRLKQVLNGVPLGDLLCKQLLLFSNTENGSWWNMEITSNNYLQLSWSVLGHVISKEQSKDSSDGASDDGQLFSATITTGHPHRTYIGAPSSTPIPPTNLHSYHCHYQPAPCAIYRSTTRAPPRSTHVPCFRPIVKGHSASSNVSSDISLSPLYIPSHRH